MIPDSEKRYRRLFETARDGILILDAGTGRIEDVNPFLTELLGYSHDELLGRELWEIGLFPDSAQSRNVFRELQKKGYIRYDDLPLETRDGKPVHVEFISNTYLVNNRKVIQCNIRDITARRLVEESLSKERDQLRLLLNVCQMSDVKIRELSTSVLNECIRISESEMGFFGFLNEDETLLTVDLWMGNVIESCAVHDRPLEFPTAGAGIWAEAIRQRKPFILNDFSRPDTRSKGYPEGHVPVIRLMSIPVIDEGKVVAEASVANKRSDYTESDCLHVQLFLENVWGILKRQRAVEALRQSEERFRTVADFTYNWETWRDKDGRYLYISPACERTSGYSVKEFMEDQGLLMKIAHPEDREHLVRHEQDHRSSDQIYNFNFRIITREGRERWINYVCQPVSDSLGNSLGRRASYRDITAQKQLEMELETNRQNLEELVKSRTKELEDLNTALKVLLQRRESDKNELEEKILSNVNELVLPYLEKLKTSRLATARETYMGIVEKNLKDIVSPFLHRISSAQKQLTPQEIQIADLIRWGRTSKEIASILKISQRTVNFHRENIRKKFGLTGGKENLRSHLGRINDRNPR